MVLKHPLRTDTRESISFVAEESMAEEWMSRRPGFCSGPPLRLAGNQLWYVPDPSELHRSRSHDPESLHSHLEALQEAEDQPQRMRACLALSIFLIHANYDLTPADLRALFRMRPGSTTLQAAQEDMENVARQYLAYDSTLVSASDESLTNTANPLPFSLLRLLNAPGRWLFSSRGF